MNNRIWAYSNSGMKIHAFAEDSGTGHRQALCSPRITRPASAIYQTTEDVRRSPLCTRCEKKDGERRARIEASMEPVNPYDQVCEGEFLGEDTYCGKGHAKDENGECGRCIAELHAEALREDAIHDARAEGFTEGAEFVPTPENRWRKGVEKVVIERLWASKTDGHVAVSFDIYNTADWQGRPYKTSSALALDLFRDLYRKPKPEGFDDTVVQALRKLRGFARDNRHGPFADLVAAIDTLDNAGVFAVVDEQTGYDVDPEPEVVWAWSANVRAEDGDRVLRTLTGSVRARTRDGAHADILEHNGPGGAAYLSDIRMNKA